MVLFRLSEVVGNSVQVSLLQRACASGKVPKFLILHGLMGTGKTSSANAVAMALTCENPSNGEACLECRTCQQNMSALKSDGVSQNLVSKNIALVKKQKDMDDLVRTIFELMRGTVGNNVYILGEIHELSPEHQSVLLEELDSMAENVTVIATTTKLNKLLPELVSRSIPYRFDRLSEGELKLLLDQTVARLGISKMDKEIGNLLIRYSKGVARDLVKMVEFAVDNKVTISELEKFLGFVGNEVYLDVFSNSKLSMRDYMISLRNALQSTTLDSFIIQGKQFLEEVLLYMEEGTTDFFTKKEKQILSGLFDLETWYNIAFSFEKLNPYSTEEEGFKLFMIRLCYKINKKPESASFSDNSRKASAEKTKASQVYREESEFKKKSTGSARKELDMSFVDKFNK